MSLSLAALAPWSDRDGRPSPLRIACLAVLVAPALWLAWRFLQGDLGPRPITEALRFCGDRAIETLIASIAITPLRRATGAAKLIGVRRMIGVAGAAWAIGHFALYAADQTFDLGRVAGEIAVRPYLTIGFVALSGLVALAVTSTDGQIRRLGGARWRRLHGLVHPIALLALLHEILQVRLDPTHVALLAGLAAAGLAVRIATEAGPRPQLVVGLVATVSAALGGAAGEVLWFAIKTRRPLLPVVEANFDVSFRIAPAWLAAAGTVAALLIGVGVAAAARRRGMAGKASARTAAS